MAEQILYPIFVLAALAFYVGIRLSNLRVRAVMSGEVKISYFRCNRGAELPDYLMQTEQNYTNQFELPVLFYVACLIAYSASLVDVVNIALAWIFVVSRLAHTYTHIRENRLLKRRRAFITGYLALVILWLELLVRLTIYRG
ncbi:MAG: MAPEG family protein [Chromatiales bacterium]|nr:MAPEG family protein [Chromatiales bacterium]